MSLASPKITCLFFTDPSVPAFLNAPAGRPLAGDLLIECGFQPTLGYVLNFETPVNYPGVAGLLGGVDIGSLSHPTESLPAPILLASGTPVSPLAVRSGLGRLVAPDERLTAITLLVPVSAARSLGAALAFADRFAIAWDASAFPHEELIDFARWLTTEKLVNKGNFAGLHAYSTAPTTPAHYERLAEILAPLGASLVTISG